MSTPIMYPVIGGLLIGAAAALMMGLLGKIAGISGIFWQALRERSSFQLSQNSWRWFFIFGLIFGPFLFFTVNADFTLPPDQSKPITAIIAGLLVGFGTKIGSGCTSGHGICGIASLSIRSIAATTTFMIAGILTVAVSHHLI